MIIEFSILKDAILISLLYFTIKKLFMSNISKNIILIIVGIMMIILFYFFPIAANDLNSLSGNLIKLSGIISAFLTVYLFAKVRSIQTEKEGRQEKINILSYKLTEFRRLLYHILKDTQFWGNTLNITAFKKSYPNYDYNELHRDDKFTFLKTYFWTREKRYSQTKVDIYLAIETIVNDVKNRNNWVFDDTRNSSYPIEYLENIDKPSGALYYYFDHKWVKHASGKVFPTKLKNSAYKESMLSHAKNIDAKFESWELSKEMIAELGSDFNYKYIPILQNLTILNQGKIPQMLKNIILLLITIFLFGIVVPITLNAISFNDLAKIIIIDFSLLAVVLGIIWLLLNLIDIINKEISINKET